MPDNTGDLIQVFAWKDVGRLIAKAHDPAYGWVKLIGLAWHVIFKRERVTQQTQQTQHPAPSIARQFYLGRGMPKLLGLLIGLENDSRSF